MAQRGGQDSFMVCPVFEVLLEGDRGGGKTLALLMDFLRHVGMGYGVDWRGILFRRTFPELKDFISKTMEWVPQLCPGATYNKSSHDWEFPSGETLSLRYMRTADDYQHYHGHSYSWVAFEELTQWSEPAMYTQMMACCRSTVPGIPIHYRATTNPSGPGHNWVKARFGLPTLPGHQHGNVIRESVDGEPDLFIERVAIRVSLAENRALMDADPGYRARISAAAGSAAQRKAWLFGDWNVVAGGMFDDVWSPAHHVVPNFPLDRIPSGWRIDRAYDHGQSAPFSVGWFAESNGEPIQWEGRTIGPVPGDLIHVAEWYGWNGSPNEGVRMTATEIAEGIIELEAGWGIDGRVEPGPADTSIFDDFERDKSVAGDMTAAGVDWEKADKGPGSRVQGWGQMRKLLKAAMPGDDGTRDDHGLFIAARCDQFIRTIPVLPRDKKKDGDVDTTSEDHIGDMARYRCRRRETAHIQQNY